MYRPGNLYMPMVKLSFSISCPHKFDRLEIWYMMALALFAGYLKDAEVSVDASSIW